MTNHLDHRFLSSSDASENQPKIRNTIKIHSKKLQLDRRQKGEENDSEQVRKINKRKRKRKNKKGKRKCGCKKGRRKRRGKV